MRVFVSDSPLLFGGTDRALIRRELKLVPLLTIDNRQANAMLGLGGLRLGLVDGLLFALGATGRPSLTNSAERYRAVNTFL